MRQWIGLAAVAALAACGGDGEKSGQGANAANGSAAASGGGTATASAGTAIQAGEWEITTTVGRMTVPGMPAGVNPPAPPPTTVRSCLSAAEAAQPGAGFFTGSGQAQGCTYQSNNIAGGQIQAVVQCSSEGTTMRTTMTGQFTPTSFDVAQQVETSAQGSNVQMESRTVGRRVGDCPAGAAP